MKQSDHPSLVVLINFGVVVQDLFADHVVDALVVHAESFGEYLVAFVV